MSSSPWWIDYNHAPPGGGYLHLLFVLHTRHGPGFPQQYKDVGGDNGFVAGGFPLDFTNARVSLEVCGELEPRGAHLVLLAQAKVGERYQNHVLTAQPIRVRSEWSWETLMLAPDEELWISLGSRHDRTGSYADGSVRDVLRDLNATIIFVLYPLEVRPLVHLEHNLHRLRAGEDYAADLACLPSGHVLLREVQIEFSAP